MDGGGGEEGEPGAGLGAVPGLQQGEFVGEMADGAGRGLRGGGEQPGAGPLGDLPSDVGDSEVQHLLLGAEAALDGAHRDLGAGGDVAQGGGLQALFVDQGADGVGDPAAPFLVVHLLGHLLRPPLD